MNFRLRMAVAIAILSALPFVLLLPPLLILILLAPAFGLTLTALTLIISFAAVGIIWALAPAILRRVFKIRWVHDLDAELPALAPFIRHLCAAGHVPVPRVGVVDDQNPNAFTFGHTRSDAHLVITQGILTYCDEEEQRAVVAHELGHVVHNDFVVMTALAVIPFFFAMFYAVFRPRRRVGRRKGGAAQLVMAFIALLALIGQVVSTFLVLLVNRYREYWADEYSGESTGRPASLASALVKVAYGLTVEERGSPHDLPEQARSFAARRRRAERRYASALMFTAPLTARALAVNAVGERGRLDPEAVKRTMAWDLWNPWATWLELKSTHPLPARRIRALGDQSLLMGQRPFIDFDLKKPEFYWDDFVVNQLARYTWLFVAVGAWLVGFLVLRSPATVTLAALSGGAAHLMILRLYKFPWGFEPSTVEECLADPKANPVKGKPVELTGRIIGRGTPGMHFREDLKLQDETGLMYLDYTSGVGLVDVFVALRRTDEIIGKPVRVRGWYRRYILPAIDL